MPRKSSPIPLALQLWDKDISKYVKATVRLPSGATLSGTPVSLPHITGGYYTTTAIQMPDQDFISVFYEVFSDPEMTLPSAEHAEAFEIFELTSQAAGGSVYFDEIVAILEGGGDDHDCHRNTRSIVREIVRGADTTLGVVVRGSNGDALDLAEATEITLKLKKSDKSVLSKTLSGGDLEIVSSKNGRFQVTLNETETAALFVARNAPAEVVVDFGSTRRIAQIKAGLTVLDRLL